MGKQAGAGEGACGQGVQRGMGLVWSRESLCSWLGKDFSEEAK